MLYKRHGDYRLRAIAIAQPYFFPYAGYYRLLAASDLFVIYDCVQFPRRGWVHRNKLKNWQGRLDWMTLPLTKRARETQIAAQSFTFDAKERLTQQLRRFPVLAAHKKPEDLPFSAGKCQGLLVDVLEEQLCAVRNYLNLNCDIVRASSQSIDPNLQRQERIITLAQRFGAAIYINSPGGRHLYDPDAFHAYGIELRFLPTYGGCKASFLERLLTESQAKLRADLFAQT